jgi:heme/copper-type cytochrome/quinol oxidase subunit 2
MMVSKAHAIEILSVLITSVVLGYIGIVAGMGLIAVDTPPGDAMHVTVIARQFSWTFQYDNGSVVTFPNGTSKSFPDGLTVQNQLYVKVGEVVNLTVMSLDVAHSFFIPQLGVHIDAIPGHMNHFWLRADQPGTYQIECTQFCGTGHYTMLGQLIATS